MATDLPARIARILLSQGRVHLQAPRRLIESGLALHAGGTEVPFGKIAEEMPPDLDIALDHRPDLRRDPLGAEAAPGEAAVFKPMLNALADWALEGLDTLQLRLDRFDAPARFDIAAPIHLPPHGDMLEFQALLGVHRAAGRLHLRREDAEGQLLQEADFPFDDQYHGGTNMEGYKAVAWPLPPHPDGASALFMSVIFDAQAGASKGAEPYFFVSDPHVRNRTRPGLQPAIELHANPSAGGTDMIWAGADLPAALQPGDTLSLRHGRSDMTLMQAEPARVELLEDQGHSLLLRSTEAAAAGRFRLHVDGRPADEVFVGTDPATVRIPVAWLDGGAHRVSLWDLGGAQKFLDLWMLLPRMMTPAEILRDESRAPFPGALAPQASHRYAALKGQMAAGHDAERLAQVAGAIVALEGGPENATLAPLALPEVEDPEVSVVIPAHNQAGMTWLTLASLIAAPNRTRFEVILVDDGSTDETAHLEKIVSEIRVVRHDTPQRFIRACNAGVAVARGHFVALLNNDVEVTAGWLDALVDAFGRFPRIGLAGSKLLYPDGRLQDAGGIVWGSGNPWQYGNRQNPWEPRFSYARQADYLSGAALMTTRAIWDEVGGLSEYLEPMYFEDTDLAFKIRATGRTTWFVPSSVVYHYEGMTSGTDTGSGFKRYQEVNRPKFKRRWAAAFQGHGRDGEAPDLEKDRGIAGRVLFVDNAYPRPDRDAGSYAALQEIRLVQSLGYKVTFLPDNLSHLGSYTEALEAMGVECIHAPFHLSVAGFLEKRGAEFDAVYITRYYVARGMMKLLKRYAPRGRILFNNADLHFLRELRGGVAAEDPAMIRAAEKTRKRELKVMRQADVVLSYNEAEHAVIESHTTGEVAVVRCPWVVELPERVPARDARAGLSFLGNYRHPPNAEGVTWFVRQVMPLLERFEPAQVLWLYGAGMPPEVRALEGERVRAAGYVADVAEAYDRHRVFVSPLLSGAGIKGKVLAALAHGVPCVLSPVAAEGIGLRHGHDCMIARTPRDWAEAIEALAVDDVLWDSLSQNARAYVRDQYSFAAGQALMRAAFEAADLFPPLSA